MEKNQSAIYYPFTNPRNETFYKNALFLWDPVDCIVPDRNWEPSFDNSKEGKILAEAFEIVCQKYVPKEEDKNEAHKELEKICNTGIPDDFSFNPQNLEDVSVFYYDKLLHLTWEMLADSGIAKIESETSDSPCSNRLASHYIMSILAACCSKGQKRIITDQINTYEILASTLVDTKEKKVLTTDWHGKLVALSLKGLDFSQIPLENFIKLRKREDKFLSELRCKYVNLVDETTNNIINNPSDIRDIIKWYTTKMESDYSELNKALNWSAFPLLISGIQVLVAINSGLDIPQQLICFGNLLKSVSDYKNRKREILLEHHSAWLLQI